MRRVGYDAGVPVAEAFGKHGRGSNRLAGGKAPCLVPALCRFLQCFGNGLE